MGVPHLEKLRDYLEKNADKSFSRTYLRDTLKQNFNTINQNLAYLVEKEDTVEIVDEDKGLYQWKVKKDGRIPKKKSDESPSDS